MLDASRIKLIAFDLFGTVFDMDGVPREEIAAYVEHVRRNDFSPYVFPQAWSNLTCHDDAAPGIELLQYYGYQCVTLSNCDEDLAWEISFRDGITWNRLIDLSQHRVYKPHVDAYRTIEKDTGVLPEDCLMVTANPTFGDIEGAAAIGMQSAVIRGEEIPTIVDLANWLGPRTLSK